MRNRLRFFDNTKLLALSSNIKDKIATLTKEGQDLINAMKRDPSREFVECMVQEGIQSFFKIVMLYIE